MVRYVRFGLGVTWNDEYGSAEVPEELAWLLSYSPYHRVVEGTLHGNLPVFGPPVGGRTAWSTRSTRTTLPWPSCESITGRMSTDLGDAWGWPLPHRIATAVGRLPAGARKNIGVGLMDSTVLSEYLRNATYESLPPEVVKQAKVLLLEGISWMAMGASSPEREKLLHGVHALEGTERSTVVGVGFGVRFQDAMLLNTAFCQVYDCNDGRRLARRDGGTNHPGRCVIPAALTLAERFSLSGKELLTLLVIGYEIASLIRSRLPLLDCGFAVACLAARAARLPPDATARLLALTRATLAQPWPNWPDDDDLDYLRLGFLARAVADNVTLVGARLDLPRHDTVFALARPFPTGESPAAAYEIQAVYIKPYPCCRALHGTIDLVRDLVTAGLRHESVVRIDVAVGNKKPELFEPVAPGAHRKRCQFSIPFAAACALVDGDITQYSFEERSQARPSVQRLQRAVLAAHDPALDYFPVGLASQARATRLVVTTDDGRRLERATIAPRGSPINPLSPEELQAKFQAWAGDAFSAEARGAIASTVHDIESQPTVVGLSSLLSGRNEVPVT